jgi:C1A family cysteine protease
VAGICEYLIKRYSGRHIDVSRLFIYYNGRRISQKTRRVQDTGVNQRNILLAVRKYGICEEKIWPYKRHLLNVEPSIEAYREASRYTVVPLRIPFNIKAIEKCLYNQIPVIIDIKLIDQTGRSIQANHGYLTIPNLKNSLIDKIDFHTVLIVGYNRNTKHFIVRNSYGRNWVKFFILFYFIN